jgi:hypothetical protein
MFMLSVPENRVGSQFLTAPPWKAGHGKVEQNYPETHGTEQHCKADLIDVKPPVFC